VQTASQTTQTASQSTETDSLTTSFSIPANFARRLCMQDQQLTSAGTLVALMPCVHPKIFLVGINMQIFPNTKLKVALMKKGLSQRDLAFGIRHDESRISRIIKGYEQPSEQLKQAIADFLDVEIGEIFF
jgi:DNA-binding XRE family transcriptional regulator